MTATGVDLPYEIFNESSTNLTFVPPPSGRGPPPFNMDPLGPFKKYANVVTTVIGMIGNIIIFYVFTRTKLKRPSTSRYLAATAFADTGFLLTVLLINVSRYYNDVHIHGQIGMCQVITFGQYAFPFLIRWYLTAVVVEKYIGVTWPRKKSQMCTVFRAKCVIISLAIMAIVCYLYVTWFFVSTQMPHYICRIVGEDARVWKSWQVLTKMDAVVNFAIPYVIMFTLMCLIAWKTWQYRKRSRSASDRFLRRRRVTTPEDKEFKTTPLMICLVTSTLILCVPNSTNRLSELSPNFVPQRDETDILLFDIFQYFEVLNSAIKVFIYILSSTSFAKQVGLLFCFFVGKSKKEDSNELQNRHITHIDDGITKTVATSTEGII